MKNRIILTFTLCFVFSVSGQIPEKTKNMLSPNAVSLGQYGDIPVSLFTGTPDINIPLYELNYGIINVPINMNYHASGVKPDQHPGWVGLGWNLNAGGMISRIVHDMPDDYQNSHRYSWIGPNNTGLNLSSAGYYFRSSDLNRSDWATSDSIKNYVFQNNASYDTEPDEFSFHFLNYSGKFYLNTDGVWNVECDNALTVSTLPNIFYNYPFGFDDNGNRGINGYNTTSFSGFSIMDEKGVTYVFGNTNSSIEYSIDFFYQDLSEWIANSWMLTKIILPNKEEINFEYERDDFVNQMYSSYTRLFAGIDGWHDSFGKFWDFLGIDASWAGSGCHSVTVEDDDYCEGMLISPVYLKEISSPAQNITFIRSATKELRYPEKAVSAGTCSSKINVYCKKFQNFQFADTTGGHTQDFLPFLKNWDPVGKKVGTTPFVDYPACLNKLVWYQLNNMSVINKENNVIKEYSFEYSRSDNQRLTLNAIKEYPYNSDKKNKVYSFEYYSMDLLPQYMSNKTDHWGYFNNIEVLPKDVFSNYILKEAAADIELTSAGTLKRITYPTGGCTEFIYEQHEYNKQLDLVRWNPLVNVLPKRTGGIRIKTINNYPDGIGNPNNKIVKTYEYNSSGILGGRIQYNFENYPIALRQTNAGSYEGAYINIYSSQSMLPGCINSIGSHIGYTSVSEINGDGGRTTYRFSNFDTGINSENMDMSFDFSLTQNTTPYSPYNSRKNNRGKLIEETKYDSIGLIRTKKEISYKKYPADNHIRGYVKALKLLTREICDYPLFYDEAVAYKIYTYSLLPEKITITEYDQNEQPTVVNETLYQYNDYKLLSNATTTNSSGQLVSTSYLYTSDAPDGNQNVICKMKKMHMLSYPVQEKKCIIKNNVKNVCGAKLWLYGLFNESANNNGTYNLWSENSLQITTPVTDFTDLDMSSAPLTPDSRFRETLRYNTYDLHENPQFVTKNGCNNSVFLWGYNSQYPVAEIQNATLDEVKQYMTGEEIARLADEPTLSATDIAKISNLRSSMPGSLVTSYVFRPLVGLHSTTFPNGTTVYYYYDTNNNLIEIYRMKNGVKITESKFDYKYSNF